MFGKGQDWTGRRMDRKASGQKRHLARKRIVNEVEWRVGGLERKWIVQDEDWTGRG